MTPAATWRPDMPPPLQAIIDKAMARSPGDRFRDCNEMQMALDRFIAVRGVLANAQSIGKFVEKLADPVQEEMLGPIPKASPLEQSVTSPALPPLQGTTRIIAPTPASTVILPPREQPANGSRPRSTERPGATSRSELKKVGAKNTSAGVPMTVLGAGAAIIFTSALYVGLSHRPKAGKPAPPAPPPVVATPPQKPAAPPVDVPTVTPAFKEEDYPIAPPPPDRPPPLSGHGARTRPQPKQAPHPEAQPQPANVARLTVTDDDPAKVALPQPLAAPAAARPVMNGRIVMDGWRKGVIVYNDSPFKWTGCEVRLPMRKYFRFDRDDSIPPDESDNIRIGNLEDDHRPPDPHLQDGWAMVRCIEGATYLWWGKQKLE